MRELVRLAALALVLIAGPAAAATGWVVAPAESRILFQYEADGKPADGVFRQFSGDGHFDPAAPGKAMLTLRIESASIDLGDPTASAFATSAAWFDSAHYREVVYRLIRLMPLGGRHYRAEGELTIRDRTRPIVATVDLAVGEAGAHATGTLEIDRMDYLLGVGPMALFVDIGPTVRVRFDLVAHPQG